MKIPMIMSQRRKVGWIIAFVYLGALHAIAFLAVTKTDLPTRILNKITRLQQPATTIQATNNPNPWLTHNLYVGSMNSHLALKHLFPVGAPYFLGDSITRRLDVATIASNAVNLGISGDSTAGLLNRIDLYELGARASSVVIAIGVNDIRGGGGQNV